MSPLALMVDVMAKMVTVPSPLCSASDVAAAACGGIDRSRIVVDAVGHADVQSILQDVLQHPCAVDQAPFLQTGGGQRLGVRHISVDGGSDKRTVTFIANVERAGVREEQMPKGKLMLTLALVLGNPGRIVMGSVAREAAPNRWAMYRRCPPDRRC